MLLLPWSDLAHGTLSPVCMLAKRISEDRVRVAWRRVALPCSDIYAMTRPTIAGEDLLHDAFRTQYL